MLSDEQMDQMTDEQVAAYIASLPDQSIELPWIDESPLVHPVKEEAED